MPNESYLYGNSASAISSATAVNSTNAVNSGYGTSHTSSFLTAASSYFSLCNQREFSLV